MVNFDVSNLTLLFTCQNLTYHWFGNKHSTLKWDRQGDLTCFRYPWDFSLTSEFTVVVGSRKDVRTWIRSPPWQLVFLTELKQYLLVVLTTMLVCVWDLTSSIVRLYLLLPQRCLPAQHSQPLNTAPACWNLGWPQSRCQPHLYRRLQGITVHTAPSVKAFELDVWAVTTD